MSQWVYGWQDGIWSISYSILLIARAGNITWIYNKSEVTIYKYWANTADVLINHPDKELEL